MVFEVPDTIVDVVPLGKPCELWLKALVMALTLQIEPRLPCSSRCSHNMEYNVAAPHNDELRLFVKPLSGVLAVSVAPHLAHTKHWSLKGRRVKEGR